MAFDDAVPVGGVAVFRFHMAPADLAASPIAQTAAAALLTARRVGNEVSGHAGELAAVPVMLPISARRCGSRSRCQHRQRVDRSCDGDNTVVVFRKVFAKATALSRFSSVTLSATSASTPFVVPLPGAQVFDFGNISADDSERDFFHQSDCGRST